MLEERQDILDDLLGQYVDIAIHWGGLPMNQLNAIIATAIFVVCSIESEEVPEWISCRIIYSLITADKDDV